MKICRPLTGNDTPVFCHKMSAALNAGRERHGDPSHAFDGTNGVMRCAQALAKDKPGACSPELKLGEQ